MRQIVRTFKKPVFVGEVANAARDIVMTDITDTNALAIDRAVRLKAAAMLVGTFAKVVTIAGRKVLHTGPFPVEGYEVLETVFVSGADDDGAVHTTRPAYHKQS